MCGDYNLRREKRYVEVDVRFTPDGKIRPLAINYDKAHTYGIDRVLAVKHGTSRLSWSAIRIRLQQMQVINGKPIHCHPLDVIRFGE